MSTLPTSPPASSESPPAPSEAPAPPGDAALQFDRVEPVANAAAATNPLLCRRCGQALPDEYWDLNGVTTCRGCHQALLQHFTGPVGWRTWGRVLRLGGGAALLGTIIYFAVLKLTGYELGLIAIVVGLLVGTAVRKASGFRGGWKMQAAAMALTYASIVSSYIPSVYSEIMKGADRHHAQPAATAPGTSASPPAAAPASTTAATEVVPPMGILTWFGKALLFGLILFAFAAAAPILAGFSNFMGWIIIGIALYEAWKLNRAVPLNVRGPLRLAPAIAVPPVGPEV